MSEKVRKSADTMMASCCLLLAGVLVHRFLIMPGAFEKPVLTLDPMGLQDVLWSVPIASGRYDRVLDTFATEWHYFPSGVEMVIFAVVVAFACRKSTGHPVGKTRTLPGGSGPGDRHQPVDMATGTEAL